MIDRRAVLAGLGASIAAPAFAQPASTRPFRMGVTLWPPDLTNEAIAMLVRFIAEECDMAAPMILGGVPWPQSLAGEPYSARLNGDLAYRPPAGHKLLFSIGALNAVRTGMAPHWAETDNQPIPAPFAGLAFDDARVVRAYTNFALRAYEASRPDWFIIGIEPNILLASTPAAWPAYKTLHRRTYEAVKERYPQARVCFSISALHLLGLSTGVDAAQQRREMLDLMRWSDMAVFSIYPHTSWDVPRPLPADFFDFVRDFAEAAGGKPIGVSESGYTSRNVMVGLIPLFGSPAGQARYMELLLAAAERDRYAFVVNFTPYDYERLTRRLSGDIRTLAWIWTYCGLMRSNGRAKPAMEVWRRYLARRVTAS